MKFIHRLGYYLGGFSLGIIILAFFLSKKKSSCDYFPDARVLKDIREKKVEYTETAKENLSLFQLDSTHLNSVLRNGDVDFSRSNTNLPCDNYVITGKVADKNLEFLIENCDSIATVQEIHLQED